MGSFLLLMFSTLLSLSIMFVGGFIIGWESCYKEYKLHLTSENKNEKSS